MGSGNRKSLQAGHYAVHPAEEPWRCPGRLGPLARSDTQARQAADSASADYYDAYQTYLRVPTNDNAAKANAAKTKQDAADQQLEVAKTQLALSQFFVK